MLFINQSIHSINLSICNEENSLEELRKGPSLSESSPSGFSNEQTSN